MKHFRRWAAVYVLIVLFAGSWIGQFFAQMAEFTSSQQSHGERKVDRIAEAVGARRSPDERDKPGDPAAIESEQRHNEPGHRE